MNEAQDVKSLLRVQTNEEFHHLAAPSITNSKIAIQLAAQPGQGGRWNSSKPKSKETQVAFKRPDGSHRPGIQSTRSPVFMRRRREGHRSRRGSARQSSLLSASPSRVPDCFLARRHPAFVIINGDDAFRSCGLPVRTAASRGRGAFRSLLSPWLAVPFVGLAAFFLFFFVTPSVWRPPLATWCCRPPMVECLSPDPRRRAQRLRQVSET